MKKKELIKELRAKDTKSLFKELEESQKRICELQFKASFRKLKNYKSVCTERQKIARIWTILSEKALAELEKEQNAKG